ncbi:MAG: glucuronyl hydrolase [Chloroflexota bacterium]|nr:MAG: glucuronyl hydrolase [Chloroflexota bacterium]
MNLTGNTPPARPSLQTSFVDAALTYSAEVTRRNLESLKTFPELTRESEWACVENGGWVGGHWTGLLWLAFSQTGDQTFENGARQWAARLAPRQNDPTTHDLGFLFELSHVLGACVTGDAALKPPALAAARTLLQRFNPRGQYLQAWGPPDGTPPQRGRMIIDTMMNLGLLFWAGGETGEPRFAQVASAHAHTALRRLVRADGSTAHVGDFDPDSGEFLGQDTHQGLSGTSCWSRGQSWAVYGFTEAYRQTGDAAFLHAACKVAGYALARLPTDHVPYWDYDSPLIPDDVRDSSAASALASGLLQLAALDPDPGQAGRWRDQAISILASLWENYSSRGRPEPSILVHGTRSKPHGLMDHGLIYGDYYFVEALTRLKQEGAHFLMK